MKTGLEGKTQSELLRLLRVARKMREIIEDRWEYIPSPVEWSRAAAGLEGLVTFEFEARTLEMERIAREMERIAREMAR